MDLTRVLNDMLGELRGLTLPEPQRQKRTRRPLDTPAPGAAVQDYLGAVRADMLGLGRRRAEDSVEE